MNAIKEFEVMMIIRANIERDNGVEEPISLLVRARSESFARRCCLERAYASGMLVSNFLSVVERSRA